MRRSWKNARQSFPGANRRKLGLCHVPAKSQSDRTHKQSRREGCRLGGIATQCIPSGCLCSAAAGMQFHCPFFKEETLAEVRFRHVSQIDNPDFLGFVQDSLAAKKPLDFSQMAGITFVDTVILSDAYFEDPIWSPCCSTNVSMWYNIASSASKGSCAVISRAGH